MTTVLGRSAGRIRPHRLPDGIFSAMPAGPSDPQTLSLLRSAALSKRLLLIRFIATESPAESPTESPTQLSAGNSEFAHALGVLAAAQWRAPAVTTDLLAGPLVGAWAAWCARRIRGAGTSPEPLSPEPLSAELSYLNTLAAVAAARTGLDAELTTWVRDGRVYLPSLGSAVLAAPDFAPARVRVSGGRVSVSADDRTVRVPADHRADAPGWLGQRVLTAESGGLRLSLTFDDLDPYRACYRLTPAVRVPAERFHRWSETLHRAWELLVRHHPARAAELAGGLRSLVPLSEAHTVPGLSATSRDAFGALALTLPRPAHLAVTLVHEFEHSVLSALLDLAPLYDSNAPDRYFAPWRNDPRPIGGLLQGAFAFLAVADLWRRFRAEPGERVTAEREFAELREQVSDVLDTLTRAPHLNADGRRFVTAMRDALDPLLAEPLPAGVIAAARRLLRQRRTAWDARAR